MQCNCITISSLIAFYVSARSSSLESIAMHCCTLTTLTTQYLHLEGKTQNTTHIYLEDKKVTLRKHTHYLIGICTKSEVLVMNAKTPEHNISIWKETYQLWMQKVMLLQFEYTEASFCQKYSISIWQMKSFRKALDNFCFIWKKNKINTFESKEALQIINQLEHSKIHIPLMTISPLFVLCGRCLKCNHWTVMAL